ncbi:RNA polymerase III subunit RPC82 family protein isoform X2 [Wolffia australiana]
MVGQHGVDLAVGIIDSHFGDIVARVCSCLLRRGSSSLQEIVRDIGLPASRVKNCLLVLVQHNCVQAYSVPRLGGPQPKAVTLYMALFDNILHRLRFPKFLGLLAEEFEDPLMAANVETTEQKALAAAALVDAERFSGLGNVCYDGQNINLLKEKDEGSSVRSNLGEKRKHRELELDGETQSSINENEVLWRANIEKFVHRLKKKACFSRISTRLGLDAAIVFDAMIESSQQSGPKQNSVASSLDEILEWVMKKPSGRLMTMQHIRTYLEELKCKSSMEDTRAVYSIDLGEIIEECRSEEVGSLVLQRYGRDAYRMFRLLVNKARPIETDNLAEITFVKKKEAPGILYKLWLDCYVEMEIAVAYPGEKRFLWRVNIGALHEHVLNDMYHAAANLSQRIAQSREQQLEIANRRVNDVQRETERLKKERLVLETSLLRLDDALMLFHDF